jgi:AGZA family xanthine/uracil permease-like MFS transporter
MFDLRARGTNARTEIIAGAPAFMTMSYIIFVQPALMKDCGMDHGAVLIATCIASASAAFLMAVFSPYFLSSGTP